MIKRQDRIYEMVRNLSMQALEQGEKPGVTAQEIAEFLNMDRGNVSKEMNRLAAVDKLVKYEGRPVKFCEKSIYEQFSQEKREKKETEIPLSFCGIIGQDGSLKMQMKQVKAAMLYPPHGLHTLLNGPTGTGKTLFAKQMYEYAKQMNMLKPDARFVTFNCAEYAENPQLIVSQIFGHKKGAFTGADKDKSGLIEQADGGILFLDEIHRLPPEGQEMLFSLMDYGKYRRLGETEKNRTAEVLIIGATTEDLRIVLLKTFLRRMPVVIKLPPLDQRPLLERLKLLELFLTQEQKKINIPVRISREVVLSLLLYECSGNIGQMKADVQLLCARAFWEYKVGDMQIVELDRKMLPFQIEQGFYKALESRDSLIQFLIHGEDYYVFSPEDGGVDVKQNIISKKYLLFHKFCANETDIEQEQEIKAYIDSMIGKEQEEHFIFNKDAMNKVIAGKVYYAVEEAVEFAEMRLKREISDNIKIGFALHVNALVEGMEKRYDIHEERLQEIVNEHPKEAKIAKLILSILEDELDISIQRGEIGYATMFLCADEEEHTKKRIGTIVIAHGNNTATSIADAVNRLLDTNHCKAINMPLNENVEEVYKRTLQMVMQVNEGRGVLLLVDMGSLNMFAERIEEETGVMVRTVGMVSTLTVLEAVRKCTAKDTFLPEIVDYLDQMVVCMLQEHLHQNTEKLPENKYAILVSCLSGMGAAGKIAEMVRAITGIEKDDSIQICCVGMEGKDEEGHYLGGYQKEEILAVVGTADLQLGTVPYISIDEIVIGAGIKRLEKILNTEKVERNHSEKKNEVIDERVLVTAMRELLEFLDAEKIISMLLPGFYGCVKKLNLKNPEQKIVRYAIHVSCMVERLIKKEILPYHNVEQLEKKYNEEFKIISEELRPLEELFQIKIPVTEKAYVVELLQEDDE